MIDKTKAVLAWLVEALRGFTPFGVCVLGSLFMQIDIGMAGFIIAGLAFSWALDMATTKAAARAEIETASKLVGALISGTDTQITVDINHRDTNTTKGA